MNIAVTLSDIGPSVLPDRMVQKEVGRFYARKKKPIMLLLFVASAIAIGIAHAVLIVPGADWTDTTGTPIQGHGAGTVFTLSHRPVLKCYAGFLKVCSCSMS